MRFIVEDLHRCTHEEALKFYDEFRHSTDDPRDHALLAANDRYFLLVAILGRRDMLTAHNPAWLYDRCREVEAHPDGYLDLWARYHYKSSIITFGGIIQEIIRDPEITVCIFSHTRGIAQKFLSQIKHVLETNDMLKTICPDVFWDKPRTQAPMWSLGGGLCVIRHGNPKEQTVEAWGLVDGQPTGVHFKLMVYDDVVTLKSITPQMSLRTTEAWEMSDNLGVGEATRKWHIGTRYCTIGATLITMADWTQKRIEDVAEGDIVVGWELRGGKRWLRPAKVIGRGHHIAHPVNHYVFDNGRFVTCTPDHRWWRGAHGGGPEYAPLALPAGKRKDRQPKGKRGPAGTLNHIRQLMMPVAQGSDRDAGWLAGIYDGEGSFKKNPNHPSGAVTISQSMLNPGVIDQIRAVLTRMGFAWSEHWTKAEGQPRMTHDKCVFMINGGWRERYRFLAAINPYRREKIAASLFGQLQTESQKLVSVEDAGIATVHWLETETGNYIADGFCSKNSHADTYQELINRKLFKVRFYAATKNGKLTGSPVFMSDAAWEQVKKKQRKTVAAQMLQNPSAGGEAAFDMSCFLNYEIRPSIVNVYITVDPSGGRKRISDRTAMIVAGVDVHKNKYLLDGFSHRMRLAERWKNLKMLWQKWSTQTGVQNVQVGYERYSMQADIEHFEQRMQDEKDCTFEIIELNWAGPEATAKEDRINRLQPDLEGTDYKYFLPNLVYVPGEGICTWRYDKETSQIVYELAEEERAVRHDGKVKIIRGEVQLSRLQRLMVDQEQPWRCASAIIRKDEAGQLYDLTTRIFEEASFFPFKQGHDDTLDAMSRIYDEPLGYLPPVEWARIGAKNDVHFVDS